MLSDRDIELARPEAFDFVFGNLPAASRADFNRHLLGCRYCQSVVGEYAELGPVIKDLPPHVEPSAELEERTVAAMVAAMAGQRAGADRRSEARDRAVTQPAPRPGRQPPPEPETLVRPVPQLPDRPMVTPLPGWRRHRVRLAAVVAAAAAIITAVIVPLSMGGGLIPARATIIIPLRATAAAKANGEGAATGRAIARQDASGTWNISLTVAHLKNFGGHRWYQCWYESRDHQQVTSAGTFRVPDSGSRIFSMTSAADPRDFPTMEITIGPPSKTGALAGTVILTGQAQ